MGGHGSGGERVGAGRKPRDPKFRVLDGNPGHRALPASTSNPPPANDKVKVPRPPDRLTAEEKVIWRRLAPEATEAGTLTPRTANTFTLLCTLTVEADEMLAIVKRDGRVYIDNFGNPKAHPLVGQHRQMAQRVEALMARFSLAPFGKPVSQVAGGSGNAQPPVNPWARIVGGSR
jgi:P27 family predicted phage terminase small subunit